MVKLIIMEGERKCVCVRERGERDTHTHTHTQRKNADGIATKGRDREGEIKGIGILFVTFETPCSWT